MKFSLVKFIDRNGAKDRRAHYYTYDAVLPSSLLSGLNEVCYADETLMLVTGIMIINVRMCYNFISLTLR